MLNNVFKEILVNKIFGFFLVFLTFTNCSLDTKSGLWTKNQTIKKEKSLKENEMKIEVIIEKGLNPSVNRNRGVKKADTELIAFINSYFSY